MASVAKQHFEERTTDVLVLGSGLAGMRAAWAALEAAPNLGVTVVSQRFGPSGSSFANINNRLGMQVCLNDMEKEAFVKEAISIAPPGDIDPALVRVLAEESEERFYELAAIGFPFDRTPEGDYFRAPGCFSPRKPRAFIYSGLSTAFEKLRDKFLSMGGRFMEGWLIQDLIRTGPEDAPRVCGAVLQSAVGYEKMAIDALSVVVALGGPAPLFLQNVGGPGTHGISHALLERAGAKLVNGPYLQFLWHEIPSRRPWPIQDCLAKDARIRSPEGVVLPVPEALHELAGERATHCPVGYDLKDTAVDLFFIENLNDSGELDVFTAQNGWTAIALMAHAGNGGARIDQEAWTGVPGLYACGESAGGMHGANRIGGAMVTGTQVFGARAGAAAAREAGGTMPMGRGEHTKLVAHIIQEQWEDDEERRKILPWLRTGMQRFALLGGRPGADAFIHECREKLGASRDWRLRLALEAALTICSPPVD
jgi:L-aspartate oxidase